MDSLKNKNEELREIFSEFKVNNMESYEKLYTKYHTLVYGVIFTVLKNKENTEDVTQEVFTKIYNMDKDKFPTKGELSWLYIVSKNEALGYIRRKREEVNIEDIYEVGEESTEIQNIIDVDTYNNIISGLNEEEKEIVSLKILSNFTFKKIGQMLSMPTPTVQWKYYKAVDSLKISIGNLALFMVSFVALMITSIKKGKRNNINMAEDISKDADVAREDQSSESTSQNPSSNVIEQIREDSNQFEKLNTVSGISVDSINLNGYIESAGSILLIGFSGVFLIISIIFAIIFKNYQQKRKKKASK